MSITVQLQKLSTQKHISYRELLATTEEIQKHGDRFTLLQLACCFHQCTLLMQRAAQQWMPTIERLRVEVCFPVKNTATKRKRNPNTTTARRRRPRKQDEASHISIDDLESRMRELSKDQLMEPPANEDSMYRTPVRQTQPTQLLSVTVAPIPEQVPQVDAFVPQGSAKSQFSEGLGVWDPPMEKYQSWIELTHKGVKRQSATKPKGANRNREERTKRKVRVDETIAISQGPQGQTFKQDFRNINSKVKERKTKTSHLLAYYNNVSLSAESFVADFKELAQEAAQRASANQDMNSQPSGDFTIPLLAMHEPQSQQDRLDDFVVNEEDNPQMSSRLQMLIQQKIGIELVTHSQVSLNDFCTKRGIDGRARGELFFQLLHMDYQLTQLNPSKFGDLLISRPQC